MKELFPVNKGRALCLDTDTEAEGITTTMGYPALGSLGGQWHVLLNEKNQVLNAVPCNCEAVALIDGGN